MLELGYIKRVLGCLGLFQFLFLFWGIIIVKSFGTLGVCRCYLKGRGNGLLSKRKRRFFLQEDHWPKPSPGQTIPAAFPVPSTHGVCVSSLPSVRVFPQSKYKEQNRRKIHLKKMLPYNLRSTKATSCCWRSRKQPVSLVSTQTTFLHQSTFPWVVSVFFCFSNMGPGLQHPLHLPCAVSWPRLQC